MHKMCVMEHYAGLIIQGQEDNINILVVVSLVSNAHIRLLDNTCDWSWAICLILSYSASVACKYQGKKISQSKIHSNRQFFYHMFRVGE